MKLYAVKTGIVKIGDDIINVILKSLEKQNLQLEDKDILALTSKIIAYAEGRLVKLADVKPSEKALKLAKRFLLKPEYAELILRESDKLYGGVEKAVLTLKEGVLTANAGIDNKNAPEGYVIFWPRNIRKFVEKIRNKIRSKTGKNVAILIVDSGLIPLRMGTTGLALAVAGFKPIKDFRVEKDIYGKPLTVTRHAVADDLASAAHLIMGEAAEIIPVVVIRGAPVDFDGNTYTFADLTMPQNECIFMGAFKGDD